MLSLADSAVLLLSPPSPALAELVSSLSERGFVPFCAADVPAARALAFRPRFAIVDTAVPGAIEHLERAGPGIRPEFVLVWIGADEREGEALAAGAALTMRRPWLVRDVLCVLERMRCESERWCAAREALDRDRTAVSVPVMDAVLGALQHELRNPLAAALSNLECLHEDLGAGACEQRMIAGEIQSSLRRVTSVLDAVSTLIDGRPLEHERVCLSEVAERAVARSGSTIPISGKPGVMGWANRELLRDVLATLIDDARGASGASEALTIRVYATGTEARISLRDDVREPTETTPSRAFEPVIRFGGDGATGLSLPLVRHAVSRMRGTIDLSRDAKGRVFRIRLRLA
jgi:signal transduction histidine kinase